MAINKDNEEELRLLTDDFTASVRNVAPVRKNFWISALQGLGELLDLFITMLNPKYDKMDYDLKLIRYGKYTPPPKPEWLREPNEQEAYLRIINHPDNEMSVAEFFKERLTDNLPETGQTLLNTDLMANEGLKKNLLLTLRNVDQYNEHGENPPLDAHLVANFLYEKNWKNPESIDVTEASIRADILNMGRLTSKYNSQYMAMVMHDGGPDSLKWMSETLGDKPADQITMGEWMKSLQDYNFEHAKHVNRGSAVDSVLGIIQRSVSATWEKGERELARNMMKDKGFKVPEEIPDPVKIPPFHFGQGDETSTPSPKQPKIRPISRQANTAYQDQFMTSQTLFHAKLLKQISKNPRIAGYVRLIWQEVDKHNALSGNTHLDGNLVVNQMWAESNFVSNAKSGKGALGIPQFTAGTRRRYGLSKADMVNPNVAIPAGIQEIGRLANIYDSQWKAMVVYNAGVSVTGREGPLEFAARMVSQKTSKNVTKNNITLKQFVKFYSEQEPTLRERFENGIITSDKYKSSFAVETLNYILQSDSDINSKFWNRSKRSEARKLMEKHGYILPVHARLDKDIKENFAVNTPDIVTKSEQFTLAENVPEKPLTPTS